MPKHTRLYAMLCLLSLVTCNENKESVTASNPFSKNTLAHWITDAQELAASDSLFYLDHPAPLFRKNFESHGNIEQATLFITAAGYYHASINGTRIGKNILDPAWTDYSKRIFYTEYDVTSMIKQKKNCLGVSLGNGFYNPLPLRKWGRRNLRKDLTVGKPVFLAKLVIQYKNGNTEEVVSDDTWKYAYGPIIKNSVYLGVTYDARKKLEGWDTPEYDDTSWNTAVNGSDPKGLLQLAFFPPVQVTQKISPTKIYSPEPGIHMVDMGVNFTGTYRIKLSGNKGDTIDFRFGERVYDDGKLNPMTAVIGQIKRKGIGGPGAPEIAWQADRYIIGDNTSDWFSPDFTYHTYRFMEIVGLDLAPQISDVEGYFFNSNVTSNNHFTCSSELLNTIQEATERTFLANLISVQSDCPAREKFGYGGDLNATSESFIYNFDMQSFYRKTILDWVDAMKDSTFVDTAPFAGIQYCGISWESAFLTTQYYLYLYYKDIEIIKELYDMDMRWMEKVARIHPEGLVEAGLSDHESLEPVPVQLTGTCHYLQCARIMEKFASVLGDQANEEKFNKLANKLKNIVKTKYWDQPSKEKINRQTLFSTLLYHEIVPEADIGAAKDSLVKAVQTGPAGHFNTGIFGTKYVLETVSKYESPEMVYDIAKSTAFPGWGYMIENGATTIWETWKESDNIYSNCHPMFGTITEWFYRWLGGIRPDPNHPGFKEFTLSPNVPAELDFVECTYNSPFGKIVSNWRKDEAGSRFHEMAIPIGSAARVSLALNQSEKLSIDRKDNKFDSSKIKELQSGNFTLESGEYLITISPKD